MKDTYGGDIVVEFDAENGESSNSEGTSIGTFDWSQLRFVAPKKAAAAASSDLSCIAKAVVGSGASASFQMTLNGATVDRVTHTRADFHTLFIRLPVRSVRRKDSKHGAGGQLKQFVDSLDHHVIDVAKSKVDKWFNRSMSGDLIEEYYRGSTTSTPALRFVITGDLPDEHLLVSGSLVNITTQLVGVQFRSQYFTCVWKIASLEEALDTRGHEKDKEQEQEHLTSVLGGGSGGFGFFPDDEVDTEEDPEEDEVVRDPEDIAYPSCEERAEMAEQENLRLSTIVSKWESVASELQEKISELQEKISELQQGVSGASANAERARVAMTKLAIASDATSFTEAYAEAEAITF